MLGARNPMTRCAVCTLSGMKKSEEIRNPAYNPTLFPKDYMKTTSSSAESRTGRFKRVEKISAAKRNQFSSTQSSSTSTSINNELTSELSEEVTIPMEIEETNRDFCCQISPNDFDIEDVDTSFIFESNFTRGSNEVATQCHIPSGQTYRKWLSLIQRQDLDAMDMEKVYSNYRVCHEHFPQGSLRSFECRSRSGIKKDALPTLHVPHNPVRGDEAQPPLEVAVDEAKQNQKMDTTNILTTQKIKNIVTKADFDLVCRCCLRNQNIIGKIQDIHFEQTHLPVIYKQLFQIQIMEENGDKPPNICHDCTSKAVQFWQFRQQVLINETLMQSLNIVTNLKREETTTSEQSQSELFFIDMNTSSIMLMKNENNRDQEVLNEHSYCHGLETNQKTFVERKPIIEQFLEKTKNIGSNMRKVFETQFTCLTCAALFDTSSELKAHEKSFNHGPKPEVKIYKCKMCGHKTNKLGSHNTHMKIHRTERAYECPECKKKFKIARGLKVHMKIHLGKRDRICEFCGKGFLEQTELVIHQRTHTGERPFMCQACGKCFTSTGMCNLHYRTVHERNTTEYEHKCEHCDRTFRKRPFLEQHISKKHLHVLKDKKDKTEHKCCVCDVTCRTKHLFDAHMKKHEKI